MTWYILVVFEHGTSRILAHEDDDGRFRIPLRLCREVPHWGYKMTEHFEDLLEEFFITSSFELAFLYSTKNEAFYRHIPPLFVSMFEILHPAELDPDYDEFVWVDVWSTAPERFKHQHDRETLPFIRRIKETCSEKGVRPWEKPGWLQMTTEQATLTLDRLGYQIESPFKQFRNSPASAILTVKTNQGLIYLKASTAREVRITKCISDVEPKLAREPLYVNEEKEWMLMEDFGQSLEDRMTMKDFENLKAKLGSSQRRVESQVQRLIDCGVPLVDPRDLLRRIENMLRDVLLSGDIEDALRNSNRVKAIKELDKNAIGKYCDRVKTLLKHLYENQRIPLTLTHGDLHTGNITRCDTENDSYVIFDWDSARIDLPLATADCLPRCVIDVKLKPGACLESYLENWVEFGSLEELEELRKLVGLREGFDIILEHYDYAVDKNLRPFLEEREVANLCELLCAVAEAVRKLEQSAQRKENAIGCSCY